MSDLYERVRRFDDAVVRNITSLRRSEHLFDDLSDGDPALEALAAELEGRVKAQEAPADTLSRSFLYSTAIGYPFDTDHWMATRYSDGSYPAWYGGLDLDTTIHETVYHMARFELAVEGVTEPVIRERCVYDVDCRAVLVDLVGREDDYPELISPSSYALTQQVGRRLAGEGHPGLIAPSARRAGGVCLVAFRERILSNPRVRCYLTYTLDPFTRRVAVERQRGQLLMELTPVV